MSAVRKSHHERCHECRPGCHGFTLIEVIIALVLLSLIMLGLVSALAGMGASASRIDERAGQNGRQWLVQEFLRATLSSSVGHIKRRLADGSETMYFNGGPQALEWLGNMPPRHGAGGLHYFRLALEPEGGRMNLVLRYAPYVKDIDPDVADIAVHVLAEDVTGLHIAYQSKPQTEDEDTAWSEIWDDPQRLPGRVRMELNDRTSIWPPLVASLDEIDAATRRTRGGATFGGSSPLPR
ncbi:MAG: prepilin-type N-terminal cleavage/methylation domain-containing protein [Azoarcus sp.]|jgi:general secretion pathway protein J|nr:prepilin-type N-terminal cleavage/methylation domain-containing protein [Azoarcus sp.]